MLRPLLAATCLVAPAAASAAPRVVTDIAPVHSLVARVMDGVGEPGLIVPPDASPHGYAMRPSEAQALQDADLVVWIGADLTPWLETAIDAVAGATPQVTLLDVPGIRLLAYGDGEHDDHGDHGDHGHDDHADEAGHDDGAEAEHAGGEAHADDHGHDHDHDGRDPHAWLDPSNAVVWVDAVADALADADPDNADAYRANAEAARDELAALDDEVAAGFRSETGAAGGHVVFHDAYRYFETAYDVPAAAAIAIGDASRPGPARIREVRDAIAAEAATCIMVEPQFDAAIARTVVEGTGARVAVIDPLGVGFEPGPALYPALIRALAERIAECR